MLYTKYFLVFMSISALSPIRAMNIPESEKLLGYLIPSKRTLQLPVHGFKDIFISESFVQEQKKVSNAEKKQLYNIKSLLQEGLDADPNLFKIGLLKTPVICVAAKHNDVGLIELLLESGVNINTRDNCGNTALHISIGMGNDFVRDYLLKRGADPNSPSCIITPLNNAIINRNASAIKSLIRYGVNIDVHTANLFVGNTYDRFKAHTFNLKKEYYPYIKTVLLMLYKKQCKDLRLLILSYLPEYHCHPGLYKELQNGKHALKPFALHVVETHTKIVQEILHTKNKNDKNVLELFPSITELNEKLLSDGVEFAQSYPATALISSPNLAFEVLKIYAFKAEYESLIPKDVLAPKESAALWIFYERSGNS